VITVKDVKFSGKKNGNFMAYVSVVVNDCFVLWQMRIIKSKKDGKLILAMPSRQGTDGQWVEIYHPITRGARTVLETEVFRKFEEHEAKSAPAN
jgi:stage V sporulation protein G